MVEALEGPDYRCDTGSDIRILANIRALPDTNS
jgi:hypothetical protein